VQLLRDASTATCSRCGALATPFDGRARAQHQERAHSERSLIDRLPSVARFLVQPPVLITVVVLALLRTALRFGHIGGLVGSGASAALFFHVVERTADGDDELRAPDFGDPWDHVLAPFLRFLATLAPLILAFVIDDGLFEEALTGDPRIWFAALSTGRVILVVWLLVWPLLIVIAALTRSFLAIYDPRIWRRFLGELGADYWIGAVAFYGILLIEGFVLRPALGAIDVAIFGPALANAVLLLASIARARVLGEVCRPHM
jgi:hypothetical protein